MITLRINEGILANSTIIFGDKFSRDIETIQVNRLDSRNIIGIRQDERLLSIAQRLINQNRTIENATSRNTDDDVLNHSNTKMVSRNLRHRSLQIEYARTISEFIQQ